MRAKLETLMQALFVTMLCKSTPSGSVGPDSTLKFAAYDPQPVYLPDNLPTEMFARRMGAGPSTIEDVVRPPRHALPPQAPSKRNLRRPLRKRQPLLPENKGDTQVESESIQLDANDVGPPLVLLSPDALKNPHRGSEDSSVGLPLPIGPPATTLRSAFMGPGVVQPPSIRPPGMPDKTKPQTGAVSMPGIRPFPPALPPSPPTTNLEAGPPTPPHTGSTPSPPDESKVTDIKCIEFGGQQTFEAILSLPDGYEAVPVFDDKPTIDPTTNPTCRMIPTQLVGMFQLIVSNYDTCGVRKCRQSNGETWNCLVLRFPRLNGLKLPEDEIIEIRCRPHDRTANDIHVLSVATANFTKPPTVFEGLQEFECEIGLFRQLPGTNQFNSRVKEDAPLELGENVQLWSIVKDGDGWEYSRLSEVVIQKQDGARERSTLNTAVLVFSDGCRNPNYRIIAPDHPVRDAGNQLVSKFTFRAFMFQDMEPGDSLLISAKVVGCILEEDCRPAVCPDDGGKGYGRRRKREAFVTEFTTTVTIPPLPRNVTEQSVIVGRYSSLLESHIMKKNVTDWSRNMAIKIRMPDDESIKQRSIKFQDCKLYLFISLGIALFFCMVSIAFVSFTMIRHRRKGVTHPRIPSSTESRRNEAKRSKKPLQAYNSSSSSDTVYSSSEFSTTGSDLRQLPIPQTVRQRKREVNAELMGLFCDETVAPYAGQYPPMMNYYGYMVVPRPPPNHQKKSLRALKRSSRERCMPPVFDSDSDPPKNGLGKTKHNKTNSLDRCSCHEKDSNSDTESQVSNHTSIIRITSSGSETISKNSSSLTKPKPKPRSSRTDHIYSEIRENTPTILV